MTKKHLQKTLKLSSEFNNYLLKHPTAYKKVPYGATVVLTVKGDEQFNRASRRLVSSARGKIVEARKESGGWNIVPLVPA